MNQSSSAITARKKTRFVVRRGKTGLNCVGSSAEGRERVNLKGEGLNIEYVPVPVLDELIQSESLKYTQSSKDDTCQGGVHRSGECRG